MCKAVIADRSGIAVSPGVRGLYSKPPAVALDGKAARRRVFSLSCSKVFNASWRAGTLATCNPAEAARRARASVKAAVVSTPMAPTVRATGSAAGASAAIADPGIEER